MGTLVGDQKGVTCYRKMIFLIWKLSEMPRAKKKDHQRNYRVTAQVTVLK